MFEKENGKSLIGDLNDKIAASGTVSTRDIISLLNTTDNARELLTKLITPEGYQNLNNESIQRITHIAELISARILATDSALSYDINDYFKNKDLISQSIRVSTYATALAKQYNNTLASSNMTSKINLEEIATAGLLANYGTICANEDVRLRLDYYMPLKDDFPGLTEDKIKELKINYDPEYVSYYSYNLLRECEQLSSFVKTAITLSSENNKATGPLQARRFNNELTNKSATIIAAKMLSLSKKFDEILSKNINKNSDLLTLEAALKELFASEEYSKDLISLFIKTIPLYPIGTKVELKGIHNGPAIVVENHNETDTWNRPTVKILAPGKEGEVDLRFEYPTQIINLSEHDIEVIDKKEDVEEVVVTEAPIAPTVSTDLKEGTPTSVVEESKDEEATPKVVEPVTEAEPDVASPETTQATETAEVTSEPVTPVEPKAEETTPKVVELVTEPNTVITEATQAAETPVEPTPTEAKEETPSSVAEEPKGIESTQESVAPVIPEVPATEPNVASPEAIQAAETFAEPTVSTEVKEVVAPVIPETPSASVVATPTEEVSTTEAPIATTVSTELKEETPSSVVEEPKGTESTQEAVEPVIPEVPSAEPSIVSPEAVQAAETPVGPIETAEVTPKTVSVAEEPSTVAEQVDEPSTVSPEAAQTPVVSTITTEAKEETPASVVGESRDEEATPKVVEPVTVTEPSVVTPEVTPTVETPVAPVAEEIANTNTQTIVEPSSEPTKVIEDIIPREPLDPIGQNNQIVTEPTPVENTPSELEESNIITIVPGYYGYDVPEQSVGMRR